MNRNHTNWKMLPENVERWQRSLPAWEMVLSADSEHVRTTETCLLVNGKPTDFEDVHAGRAIYIGRSNENYDLSESDLANPFTVDEHGRLGACLNYTEHLMERIEEDPRFHEQVMRCYGRPLACWCIPELCHGNVIALYLGYRIHIGWEDPERISDQIQRTLESHVESLIQKGEANPAKYHA